MDASRHAHTSAPARQVILASSSPRRRELIALLDLPVEIIAANVDEEAYKHGDNPAETVRNTALAKAQAVAQKCHDPSALIIAADTIVVYEDIQLGKPQDNVDARRTLKALAGKFHQVMSGLVVGEAGYFVRAEHPQTVCLEHDETLGLEQNRSDQQATAIDHLEIEIVTSLVKMRPYSDAEIDAYIAGGDPLDKAGSYAIQHHGFHPVEWVDGCPLNVVGLPVCRLRALLARFEVVSASPAAYCQAKFRGACLDNPESHSGFQRMLVPG